MTNGVSDTHRQIIERVTHACCEGHIILSKCCLQMAEFLGADGVHFLSLNDLQDSITECNPALTAFEASVFNGEYVTGDIDDAFFATMAEEAQL